jgi:RimJ/RimL family protein N-acetyltransferase/pimeloyl-ACP methyl ester carboxylesterase
VTLPRLVFVHGSVGNAELTFAGQRALAERFELVFHTRSGYPPGPPLERIDFEDQAVELAAELQTDDHLVAHSYGAVVSLLAAARNPVIASLVVGEPPAFGVAPEHPAVCEFMRRYGEIVARGPLTPKEYLESFLPLVGLRIPTGDRLSPTLEQGTRAAMAERPPNEAVIPLDELARAPFRTLVISGGHSEALDAVCDVLEERLSAERAVLPGVGHSLPRAPGFNETVAGFVERARVIETERLRIARVPEDAREAMVALWLDPVNERLRGGESEEQVRTWVEGTWGVWERASGELVGDCTLFFADEHGEWELAYGLRRDRWGFGYASEAARACVRHGFEFLGLERIVADVDPANRASVNVLEKAGFVRIGGSGSKLLYAVTRP